MESFLKACLASYSSGPDHADLLRFPETKTIIIYHDNPDITDETKLRVSVSISVPPDTAVDGEIGKMVLPAGKYALARFELSDTGIPGSLGLGLQDLAT
jgi:DNA gyrase inhibitor GyrI